jgi:DNA repair ATPase RecN
LAKREQKKQQLAIENCSFHNLPLGYYCETCNEALCSDCAMFEDKHKQHTFRKISEVYEKHIDEVKSEASELSKRLEELNFLVTSVEDNITRVQKAKEERAAELKKAYCDMQEKLQSQLKSKLDTLGSKFLFSRGC